MKNAGLYILLAVGALILFANKKQAGATVTTLPGTKKPVFKPGQVQASAATRAEQVKYTNTYKPETNRGGPAEEPNPYTFKKNIVKQTAGRTQDRR